MNKKSQMREKLKKELQKVFIKYHFNITHAELRDILEEIYAETEENILNTKEQAE